MKIAIPILHYNKEGGIERHTWEMAERWSRGHEVHIFASQFGETGQNIICHNVPVFKSPGLLRTPSFVVMNSLKLRKMNFDIIYNNGCGATFIQDVIVAASSHRAWAEESKKAGLKRFFLNPLHYWTFAIEGFNYRRRRYKKIIAISHLIKRLLIKCYNIPSEDIEVISLGVNLKDFHPSNRNIYREIVRKELGIPEDNMLLLFVGKEFRRKGLKYIFDALNCIKNEKVKLLVIGEGEITAFKNMAGKLGISERVIFLGHSTEVEKYYAASDIFIFPSTFDAFGMVVLEAMASGIPVIVSISAGASELVEHMKEGIVLKEYSDVAGISKAIELLVENKSLRLELGRNSRIKAEACSWDMVAEKTMKIFSDVTLSKGNKGIFFYL